MLDTVAFSVSLPTFEPVLTLNYYSPPGGVFLSNRGTQQRNRSQNAMAIRRTVFINGLTVRSNALTTVILVSVTVIYGFNNGLASEMASIISVTLDISSVTYQFTQAPAPRLLSV
jgi:hypothetical protein